MYIHIVSFLCCAVKNRGRYTEQNRARTESKTYIQHLQMITFCVLILLLLFPLDFVFGWLFSISKIHSFFSVPNNNNNNNTNNNHIYNINATIDIYSVYGYNIRNTISIL